MPGCKEVVDYDLFKEKAEKILDQAEWVFCLDFNALHRTKNLAAKLEQGYLSKNFDRPSSATR
jgi:phosphoesterase RecJ-like protein